MVLFNNCIYYIFVLGSVCMILVSACLVGINCKYNGGNNYNENITNLVREGLAIPMCAEQLGGLTTPRVPAEIKYIDGKRYVIDANGKDVTNEFERGAKEVLEFVKRMNIKKVILKSKSPSCGIGKIYNGNFENKLVSGNGILAEMLIESGIEVISSDEYVDNFK